MGGSSAQAKNNSHGVNRAAMHFLCDAQREKDTLDKRGLPCPYISGPARHKRVLRQFARIKSRIIDTVCNSSPPRNPSCWQMGAQLGPGDFERTEEYRTRNVEGRRVMATKRHKKTREMTDFDLLNPPVCNALCTTNA